MRKLLTIGLFIGFMGPAVADSQLYVPGGPPTGTAGGSLGGTYPNPTVTTNANLTGDVTSVGNATTLAAGSASNLNSGTLAIARGGTGVAVAPARVISTPGNPSGTSSATQVMMGLNLAFTPVTTGKMLFMVSGTVFNGTILDGCQMQIRFGTGTAPVNGAAATGTTSGAAVNIGVAAANQSLSFSLLGYNSGLTINTAEWMDIGMSNITAGTCSLQQLTLVAIEQ